MRNFTFGQQTSRQSTPPKHKLQHLIAALFSIVLLLISAPVMKAAATSSTTTTLAIAAGGTAATTVNIKTVVTLTATVTGAAGGQVIFCDTATPLCQPGSSLGLAQITTAGTATMRFVPGPGIHNYKAVYLGTATLASSTSTVLSLTVTGQPVAVFLNSLATPGASAGTYNLSGQVTANSSGLPSGSVTFTDTTANSILGKLILQPGNPPSDLFYQMSSASAESISIVCNTITGDFNNDGLLDAALANCNGTTGFPGLSIFLGKGNDTFTTPAIHLFQDASINVISAADFNNDGNLDLVVGSQTGLGLLLGNGDGTFSSPTTISASPCATSSAVVSGDFNNDGNVDIALTCSNSSTLYLLLGDASGNFTQQTAAQSSGAASVTSLVIGDFNADGRTDLAMVASGSLGVLINNGDNTFRASSDPSLTSTTWYIQQVAVGDVDGDGKQDLILVSASFFTLPTLLPTLFSEMPMEHFRLLSQQ